MNNWLKALLLSVVPAAAIVVAGLIISSSIRLDSGEVGGSMPSVARVATSSTEQVGPQLVKTIFAENQSCASRVISVPSGGSAVSLTFDISDLSDLTPSGTTGILVAASGTTALPASVYGCGPVKAYAAASTTITKVETVN